MLGKVRNQSAQAGALGFFMDLQMYLGTTSQESAGAEGAEGWHLRQEEWALPYRAPIH